jgi:RNA polymerase sigma-70 factor (ECF subfamily)
LHESDRELLALVAWEGLAREELALALGTSRAAVRVRLHRARRRLREALGHEAGVGEGANARRAAPIRLTGGEEHECG